MASLTKEQERIWQAMKEIGCAVRTCRSHVGLARHHCGTGAGGRKDEDFVIPLCYYHHQGAEGIDRKQGKCLTKKSWQSRYGTERELWDEICQLIDMP